MIVKRLSDPSPIKGYQWLLSVVVARQMYFWRKGGVVPLVTCSAWVGVVAEGVNKSILIDY